MRSNINFSCLHICWMWCVLVESILLLDGNGRPTFYWFMSTAKCYGEISIRRTMSLFAMVYFPQFTKSCLVKKQHVCLSKGKKLSKNMETSTWHQMEPYIRMYGSTKALHYCLIFYQTLYYFRILPIKHMWILWLLLFIDKRGLWPLFPLLTKVCKIKNFKQATDEVGILTSFKFREVSI